MELEANQGCPNQGHCTDLAVESLSGGRNAVALSGDPEVKLKSVSIWRTRDSAVCPAPASLPPNPVLPMWKFSPPMLPCELPPQFGMPPWGDAVGGKQRDALASHSQDLPAPAPHHSPGFPSSAAPTTPHPQVASIKRITEQNDEREGITGHYQP